MPALSPTMTEGKIVGWNMKEGDSISPGDSILEVQTDKSVVSLDFEEEGTLAKIIKSSDDGDIKVGDLIGLVAESDEDWREIAAQHTGSNSNTSAATGGGGGGDATLPATPAPSTLQIDQRRMGPATKKLMLDYAITQTAEIASSGPHGELLKHDLEQYITATNRKLNSPPTSAAPSSSSSSLTSPLASPVSSSPSSPPPPPHGAAHAIAESSSGQPFIDIPLTNMRKTIAKRLSQSKSQIPHFYSRITCCMDGLIGERAQLKRHHHSISVSLNDFIIKAAALSLRLMPEVSGHARTIDISIAVATESGLITPIVFDADRKSVREIGQSVRELASRARSNKLQPHEYEGGCFSISNLGMFGVRNFTAIINPPQAAILAVGANQKRVVLRNPGATTLKRGGRVGAAELSQSDACELCLSADAAKLDGDVVARFLATLRKFLENPQFLIEPELET